MKRLNTSNLPARFALDDGRNHSVPSSRIVHIGLGQFAKAHLLYFTNRVNSEAEPWRVTGINLNSPRCKNELAPQEGLYTVTARTDMESQTHLISIVDEVLFAGEDIDRVKAVLLAPETKIVSFTITEKGYHQSAQGRLDSTSEDVRFDLDHPDKPRTAVGWLVWVIRERRSKGLPPITPLSLDNLNQNGTVLRQMVLDFVETDQDLAKFVAETMVFPNSMVDRIVPAITTDAKERVAQELGVRDEACVVTEVFCQWVLEDKFVSGRPKWESAGVQLCDDVEPFEKMKLRLLNGAHSALAYIGHLLGCETVSDCVGHPDLSRFLRELMLQEILPQVSVPGDANLDSYVESLLLRFANSELQHRCLQIAMDGSQKIPQRWLPVIQERLGSGQSVARLSFAVAAWTEFLRTHEDLDDPDATRLQSLAFGKAAKDLTDIIERVFAESRLFDEVAEQLMPQVREQGKAIATHGIADALKAVF